MTRAILLLLIAVAGCGGPANKPATVHGRVLFQDRPLAGGVVVFAPNRDRGNAGPTAFAAIDADGNYALANDGVPTVAAGWYRVAIAPPADLNLEASGFPAFPAALRRPDRSGVEREVTPGTENVIDLHVAVGP
jgi:hypothetical protein